VEIGEAATELRAFVHDLMPPALLALGLAGAVDELVAAMPIPTRLIAQGPDGERPDAGIVLGRVAESVERAGYLVVAEALSNVVKHARASRCTVTLGVNEGMLQVRVEDDGVGGADPVKGFGLDGIGDRVRALGGMHGIDTAPEGGVSVWANIPTR
jgi:signal transduction histidine kinase